MNPYEELANAIVLQAVKDYRLTDDEAELAEIERFRALEEKLIPSWLDYNDIRGIRIEAKQKLIKQQPRSIGQASRISGVSPADISVLLIYLSGGNRND